MRRCHNETDKHNKYLIKTNNINYDNKHFKVGISEDLKKTNNLWDERYKLSVIRIKEKQKQKQSKKNKIAPIKKNNILVFD